MVSGTFRGGDVWFEGNYTGAVFDPDHPTDMSKVDLANMNANGTTVASDTSARTLQNRFNIADDLTGTGATITSGGNLIIRNADASGGSLNGGAIYVGSNSKLTLSAAGGDITFTGNTDRSGANDIYLAGGNTLLLTGSNNMFFGSGIDGAGTINKTRTGIVQISENSAFGGATAVSGGTLCITSDKTFGTGATGTMFTLATGATLSGQGTIMAKNISISGILDPDADLLSSGSTTVAGAKKFGILTLDGDATLTNFIFNYDANAPSPASPMGDLLVSQNGVLTITSGTINLQTVASRTTGKYLLIDAANDIVNVLGIQFRGYIDFGVKEQDWRGVLKMKGEA